MDMCAKRAVFDPEKADFCQHFPVYPDPYYVKE